MVLLTLLFIAVLGLIVYVVVIFNRLVALKNRYQNMFSQIDIQLRRRYDLIPNLVETVKGYLAHERETLESVTAARNQAIAALSAAQANPGSGAAMANLSQAEQGLSSALGRLNMVMEAYPQLRATENVQQLSEELTTTENKIAFARQGYNDSVMAYNTYRQQFPNNIVAGAFGHQQDAALLEMQDREAIAAAPKVSLS